MKESTTERIICIIGPAKYYERLEATLLKIGFAFLQGGLRLFADLKPPF